MAPTPANAPATAPANAPIGDGRVSFIRPAMTLPAVAPIVPAIAPTARADRLHDSSSSPHLSILAIARPVTTPASEPTVPPAASMVKARAPEGPARGAPASAAHAAESRTPMINRFFMTRLLARED